MNGESIIFLDFDGVLNCELFYEKRINKKKKELRKKVKKKEITRDEYHSDQLCPDRIALLNKLCEETGALVVVSSSWRIGMSVEELQKTLSSCGATFTVIDKTPWTGYERGTEISKWLKDNVTPATHGCYSSDFYKYVIIDDDSDMLLRQGPHFFQTNTYSGLTPNICYRIKRFLNRYK